MPTSRRNMIVGLGALTVGGGAVFGSGAFSSVSAERSVEVNVINNAGDIADEFVDVVIDPTDYDSIGLDSATDVSDSDYDQTPSLGGDAASLVADDLTIVFGATDSGDFSDLDSIPANSTVAYNDLFTVINDGTSGEGNDFTVTFDFDDEDGSANYDLSFEDTADSPDNALTVDEDSNETMALTELTTGGSDDTDGLLTITIEEA